MLFQVKSLINVIFCNATFVQETGQLFPSIKRKCIARVKCLKKIKLLNKLFNLFLFYFLRLLLQSRHFKVVVINDFKFHFPETFKIFFSIQQALCMHFRDA